MINELKAGVLTMDTVFIIGYRHLISKMVSIFIFFYAHIYFFRHNNKRKDICQEN